MRAQLPVAGRCGSDAFFPFVDGIDEAAKHGITAVIQHGGSVRDEEVIAAANGIIGDGLYRRSHLSTEQIRIEGLCRKTNGSHSTGLYGTKSRDREPFSAFTGLQTEELEESCCPHGDRGDFVQTITVRTR